jgi:hypothetical protein
MHQAAYHARPKIVEVLIELCKEKSVLAKVLTMESNPCGRGSKGFPLELAVGGDSASHKECAALIENNQTKEIRNEVTLLNSEKMPFSDAPNGG